MPVVKPLLSVTLMSLLLACSATPPTEPPPLTRDELIARYENALRAVLEPEFAEAVIEYAQTNGQPGPQNLGPKCGEEMTVTEEELAPIPPSLRKYYRCDVEGNDEAKVMLWGGGMVRPDGEVDRLICAGVDFFTNDAYDGELERYGEKADIREACMDGAQNLARLYRERAMTTAQ